MLGRLVARAAERAKFAGARVDVLALASVRATREASVTSRGDTLPSIIGIPMPGETVDGRTFDGQAEVALFPGDLPDDFTAAPADVRFVRFRPPRLERTAEGLTLSLPHIRLDRALEFLLGDKLA
jgi:predicted YcjX-like family ATPase